MILELIFLIGLTTGLLAGVILFYIIYYDELKAAREFNERQEQYKKMI